VFCTPGVKNSTFHPHVHCVVPAGGLSLDHTHWVKSRHRFFLPSKCSVAFFAESLSTLSASLPRRPALFHGDSTLLAQPKTFAAWLRPLYRKTDRLFENHPRWPQLCSSIWVATPIAWPLQNHRLVSFADGEVTFVGAFPRTTKRTEVDDSIA